MFVFLTLRYPVAKLGLGEDVSGVARIAAPLAAQPLHVGAHRT